MEQKKQSCVVSLLFIVLLIVPSLACGNSASSASVSVSNDNQTTTTRINVDVVENSEEVNSGKTAVTDNMEESTNSNNSSSISIPSSTEIIGTIEATIDGNPQTWHILNEKNCHWGATTGTSHLSLIGYEDPASLDLEQITYNGNLTPSAWNQPYNLGLSHFIIEFDNPTPFSEKGELDLHSMPRDGAHVGDSIFMSYTNAAGDFIHGISTIKSTYNDNGDGTFSFNAHFTTDEFAERDSAGLMTLNGIENGRFTITQANSLDTDAIMQWLGNCQ